MAVQFIQFNQSLSLCGHLLIGHHDVLRLLPWEGHQVGGVVDAGFLQVHEPIVHQHEGLPPAAFPGTSLALPVAVRNGPYLPQRELIEEGNAADAYFAHEQFIGLMGVQTFFPSSPSSSSAASKGDGSIHAVITSDTDVDRMAMSLPLVFSTRSPMVSFVSGLFVTMQA